MSDVERDLKELFNRRAASVEENVAIPAPVLRRARLRRALTAGILACAVLAASAVGYAGTRTLFASPDVGPAVPVPSPDVDTGILEEGEGVGEAVIVERTVTSDPLVNVEVSNSIDRGAMTSALAVGPNAGGDLCLSLRVGHSELGACYPRSMDGFHVESLRDNNPLASAVAGIVPEQTATLAVNWGKGERSVDLIDGPGYRVFHVAARGVRAGDVVARDGTGEVVGSTWTGSTLEVSAEVEADSDECEEMSFVELEEEASIPALGPPSQRSGLPEWLALLPRGGASEIAGLAAVLLVSNQAMTAPATMATESACVEASVLIDGPGD